MQYRPAAFDHFDTVLCVGQFQIEEIRKREQLYHLPPKKLVNIGYHRLDRLYAEVKRRKQDSQTLTKVLIAPSWGNENILESCGLELVRSLLKEPYRVTLRPHPQIIRNKPFLINEFIREFNSHPHFAIDRAIESDDSILQNDILITDWSGIALEFATERPVLFIDVPRKIRNRDYELLGIEPIESQLREHIGVIMAPEQVGNVDRFIKRLHSDHTEYRKRIVEQRARWIENFGHSAEVGPQEIVVLMNSTSPL
jgi:YidC/Oxa1 family membrane protein insertase